jgi:small conductance mechanosensitive channel
MSPTELWAKYGDAVIDGALNVLIAAAILFVGMWLAGALASGVRRAAKRNPRFDDTLAAFFASLVRYGLMALVIIAVLDRFGVQTTQIIAVLGAATLAIGLALQGTLSNVAAGVMLMLFRPYKLDDFVEIAGQKGVVKDINIFTTELASLDNVKIVLPNGQCWGAPISNFTAHDTRRAEMTFAVGYEADLNEALAVIEATVKADPRVLATPAPLVKVTALGDHGVTILAHVWTKTADLLAVKMDAIKAVKEALDRAGVPIPFPTQVAYHFEVGRLDGVPKAPQAPPPVYQIEPNRPGSE